MNIDKKLNHKLLLTFLACLIGTMVVLMSGCGKKGNVESSHNNPSKPTIQTDTSSENDDNLWDEDSADYPTVPSNGYYTIKKSSDYYLIDIMFHQFRNMTKLNDTLMKMANYYADDVREEGKYYENLSKGEPEMNWGVPPYVEAHSTVFQKGRLLTVTLKGYHYPMGAAHGMHIEHNFMYDLKQQVFLSKMDIFRPSFINQVDGLIRKHCDREWLKDCSECEISSEKYNEREYLQRLSVETANYCRLSDEGLVFYFGDYVAGAYCCGTLEVTVPYEELKNYLRIKL